MSLTTGRGPLSTNPAGRFNTSLPPGVMYAEPFRRRVRAIAGGRTVVDSERALLVHRQGQPPSYAFPAADVHGAPSEAESAADGYVRVPWDGADAWYEEDEEVLGHPRNPYHRVDCVRTSRRLRVEADGVTLVDTADTVGVYETALEPRLYVRRALVRNDLLTASPTRTYCPYKGFASYWTVAVGEDRLTDVAWSYEDPLPECEPIRGLLSFDETRVTVLHDLPAAPGDPGG